jgi:glycosyltransferase involved in cell wall biosynthesis
MRICYVLLSPTYGMHQYTAYLADRMSAAGHEVHLVTTTAAPHRPYSPQLPVSKPIEARTTGLSTESLRIKEFRVARRAITACRPDAVHFTGPHIWNVHLARALCERGVPVVHTLHDLEPHAGNTVLYRSSLRAWNALIIRKADHVLLHCARYRDRLIRDGRARGTVTHTPLLFLPLSHAAQRSLDGAPKLAVEYEPWALFFGRLEAYKGLECLLSAHRMMDRDPGTPPTLVIAGPGDPTALLRGAPPRDVELRNRLIGDAEAIDLLRRCGLLVLPYLHATQSALVATAYYFQKPVLVSRTGALPEYVVDGRTGRIVEPGHPPSLARCLKEMLQDPDRLAAMGMAGRAWYEEQRKAELDGLLSMYARFSPGK